jgi:hypothetical protein
MNGIVLDAVLEQQIEDHILGNLLVRPSRTPLILGIFGPSGEGKTFQVEEVLRRLGLRSSVISPGELESNEAGRPAAVLRREYRLAGEVGAGQPPAVLVIHDVDTALGEWGQLSQYTVNRQLVYGELMALADHPNEVAGRPAQRVPIVVTGNDSTKLYPPLTRPGRMKILSWAPDADKRRHIVSSLFPHVTAGEIVKLLKRFPYEPIAFWGDVSHRCYERVLIGSIRRWPRENLLAMLHQGGQIPEARIEPPSVEEIRTTADELFRMSSHARTNFLATSGQRG